jgi:hypothetical protein
MRHIKAARSISSKVVGLDNESRDRLDHCHSYLKYTMSLSVSDSVLIRRALQFLVSFYDEQLKTTPDKADLKLTARRETTALQSAAQGITSGVMPEYPSEEPWPTWSARIEAKAAHSRRSLAVAFSVPKRWNDNGNNKS